MTDEQVPVSEGEAQEVQPEVEVQEEQQREQERQVPLSALEAERRKRQEVEAQARLYEQYLAQQQQPQTQEEDGDDLVTKKEYRQTVEQDLNKAKREILEEAFVQGNPSAYQQVNDYLPELIKQKPWVKDVVENAPNRGQRAWELINDVYMPQQQAKQQKSQEAQRSVENTQKPGSPMIAGKSHVGSKVEYLRSIRGTPDWDEYRSKLRKG